MTNEQDILKALENIYAPGGISLTRVVSGIVISDGKAFVSLTGDPQKPQPWEVARRNAEMAIKALPGVEAAIVTLTADRVAGSRQPSHKLDHAGHDHGHKHTAASPPSRQSSSSSLANVRFMIAVASGKGGVGKSTTAVNLALGLSAQGWRVGLLDADIYGPSAPRLFGLNKKPIVEEGKLLPLEAHGVKIKIGRAHV